MVGPFRDDLRPGGHPFEEVGQIVEIAVGTPDTSPVIPIVQAVSLVPAVQPVSIVPSVLGLMRI